MQSKHDESFWIDHLMRRAGFGATPDEAQHFHQLGFEGAVNELVDPSKVSNDKLDDMLSKQDLDFTDMNDVRRWWIYRMTFSTKPLEEKLTLFWHGHFATSRNKGINPYLMYQQNLLFRTRAFGSFNDMLMDVSKDPAMIAWLDNSENKKGKPNENYAREIMELFTLGIGNYSEDDVKQAARAFTGWQAPNGFYFNRKQHDFGEKEFLGSKGFLNGEDVISILAAKDATASHLSKKLIEFLSHDNPKPEFVARIAEVYQQNNQSIREVVRAIFMDKSFRSDQAYHAKIKSPAEFVVGTLKTLQVTKLDGDLPSVLSRMGQNLFEPPNVKGWDGGLAWIATDTLMERYNFSNRMATSKFDSMEGYINPSKLVTDHGLKNSEEMVDYMLNLLVDGDVPKSTRRVLVDYLCKDLEGKPTTALSDEKLVEPKMRGLIHLIMTLPTYQLC